MATLVEQRAEEKKDCWSECVADKIPLRCPDGNFAEKAVSVKPEYVYIETPFPFDGRTTYKTFYNAKIFEPRVHMIKPIHTLKSPVDKLDDKSLYKTNFVQFPTIPYKRPEWAKDEEFHPNEGAVSGVTSYKEAYQTKIGRPAQSTKKTYLMDPDRPHLDTRTTYRCNFNPYCSDQFAKRPAKPEMVHSQCVPFRHTTTYKSDFVKQYGEKRKSMRGGGFKFGDENQKTGTTMYRTEFEPFYFTKGCNILPEKHYDQIYPRYTC